ncbi:MAG: hypothetical protein IKN74_05315 [Clostridia bacterium]|nr:hypothetical protein [Clostridia bacterium]
MKSFIKKTSIVLALLLVVIIVFNNSVYAAKTVSSLIGSATWNKVKQGDQGTNGITDALNTILGIVQIAGTGIALISITLTGIRYMLASVEDKAQTKKYLVGALIGSLLLFGGIGIMKIIQNVTTTAFKN